MIQIHIEKMTMGFRIHVPVVQAEAAVLRYAQRLHAPKIGRDRGRVTTEVGEPFYLRIQRHKVYFFHLEHLQPIKDVIEAAMCGTMGSYEFVETTLGHVEPYGCQFKRYGFQMEVTDPESRFFYQNDVVATASNPDRFQTIFAIQTGRGKSLVHGEKVRIPEGWKKIEELEVGDQVIGRDGKPANVTGVFPQGETENYRVTMADGRHLDVSGDHLWSTAIGRKRDEIKWELRTTNEMIKCLTGSRRLYIPLNEPVENIEKELPIDPYVLGVLIGDGTITDRRLRFCSPDPEVVDRVMRGLPDGYQVTSFGTDHKLTRYFGDDLKHRSKGGLEHPIYDALVSLGLFGKKSHDKFIPEVYLEGSIEQRWELLRGLMDTDGTAQRVSGTPSYSTASPELAKNIQSLVRSLGGFATCRVKRSFYTYLGEKREGRLTYKTTIGCRKPSELFHLPRKKKLCIDNGQMAMVDKLRVTSIEPIGYGESTCISIDNEDRLFIAGEWVTQHNTKSAQKTMVKLGTRTVIIVRPSYIDKWEYDTCRDKTGLRERRKRVYIAKGVRGITEMLYEGMRGDLDKRRITTIIIPTTSLQLWLKDYCENPQQYTQIEIGHFYNYLKAGLVLHDEIHEHFLLVYLSAIAMNPPKLLEMSATIDPSKNKQFICERYLERFPLSARLSVDYIPVVDVAGIYYNISDPKFCAKANRMKLYSHTTYEKNLYQHGIIDQYFDMIYDLLQRGYLSKYQKGQKALIFFSLVQTCKDFQSYLDRRLAKEGWSLNTAKYNAGDSYDKFMAADIGVSTPGKAGTAIDIPGLVLALVTIPIDDKQLNEQITGRPREVTAWDLTPKVLFLHCLQVSKHNRYLRSRKRELEKIVKSFKIAHSAYDLKGGKPRGITSSVHRPNLKRVPLPNSSSLSKRRGGFKRGRKKW